MPSMAKYLVKIAVKTVFHLTVEAPDGPEAIEVANDFIQDYETPQDFNADKDQNQAPVEYLEMKQAKYNTGLLDCEQTV
jgi:hypothetical protein